eukprot:254727-Chlamydomonas_euryale.AAC.17
MIVPWRHHAMDDRAGARRLVALRGALPPPAPPSRPRAAGRLGRVAPRAVLGKGARSGVPRQTARARARPQRVM